mgnify:CR=1 FL=1
MVIRGRILALTLALCLALSACAGRMPPPAPPEASADTPPSSQSPEPSPAGSAPEAFQQPEDTSGQSSSSSGPTAPGSASQTPPPSSGSAPESLSQEASSAPAPGEEGASASASEPPKADHPKEPPKTELPDQAGEANGSSGSSSVPPPEEPPRQPDLPESCQWQSITEASLLTLINKERARQGKVPLTCDPDLATAARLRAGELYQGNYVAHTRPDGTPWETVLQQEVPTDYAYAGENLAWSNHLPGEELGAFQWFRLWQESKSHLAAMVNERYTHCGIAVLTGPYYEGEAQSYAVAVFCSY